MNDHERDTLCQLLAATWPHGPRAAVWADVVGDLDHPLAHRAYLRLRDTLDRTLTVPRFRVEYAEVRHEARRDVGVCRRCANWGWVTVWIDGCRYSTACDECEPGREASAVQRSIAEVRATRRAA